MVDSCTVTRGDARTFDPVTRTYTTPAGATVYSGACRVQVASAVAPASPDVDGYGLTTQRITVHVPVSSVEYRLRDVVTVTAALMDPTLVGKRFRVVGGHAKTFATARRLECVEAIEDD